MGDFKCATSMFGNLSFRKSVDELKTAFRDKITEINDKIGERESRIVKLREEYGIDDGALISLLRAARDDTRRSTFSYMSNSAAGQRSGGDVERVIGAGVVMNLLTESDLVSAERESVKRLEQIVRNLRPITYYAERTGERYTVDTFAVTHSELEYLGL